MAKSEYADDEPPDYIILPINLLHTLHSATCITPRTHQNIVLTRNDDAWRGALSAEAIESGCAKNTPPSPIIYQEHCCTPRPFPPSCCAADGAAVLLADAWADLAGAEGPGAPAAAHSTGTPGS
eukprot:1195581-Prorocentrum_minimum.AAC.4